MASISDRLKALGVSLGSEGLAPRKKRANFPIEQIIDGQAQETPFGEAFVVEEFFPSDYAHGAAPLRFPAQMDKMAAWGRDARIASIEPEGFLFLDTETTGLSGSSATFAFLIGAGRFEEGGFRQQQFFLRDPIEEPALLAALESFAAPADALVTFNGKAFDIPLLNTRYLTNAAPPPFDEMAHLDLLHLARRLWRDVLPSRALGDLEIEVLDIKRTADDIPGWMIPQLYTDYLYTGDARPLSGVFYHNTMDILSIAALFELMAGRLAAPLESEMGDQAELYAIGRLFADLGFSEEAIEVFEMGLGRKLPEDVQFRLVENLACLHRRKGDYQAALKLWEMAAGDGHVYAHVEIAKYYEHRAVDLASALNFTLTALDVVNSKNTPRFDRLHWTPLLEHRRARLERRLARQTERQ
ncbi:MAG: hypothetical protein DWG76_00800 [Chloroflexi bacterium]|nr:ribonuclease H-like domain-containing protein [Chloroflexota bacterium]MQC25974.1 hypothetical protein [Chloroflexota bacterium]